MGHLARTTAFFYTQNIDFRKAIILTTNPLAQEVFKETPTIFMPLHLQENTIECAEFIANIIKLYAVQEVYIDSFPVGILGELQNVDFSKVRVFYLARLLNWQKYRTLFQNINYVFEKVWICEDLHAPHQDFIQKNAKSISNITLTYPPEPFIDLRQYFQLKNELWLIIHSQPKGEVEDLYTYAKWVLDWKGSMADFVIISACRDLDIDAPNVYYFNTSAAYMYLPQADKIFTAAGFNLLQQAAPYKEKHYVMPFQRGFDLQFERAKAYKKR